ncbi:MAG: molybdate ABC transporter substrate-binding protein [Proteobacteria bacterium]|nr:molybdate ABC transporter substrate-binding protein [Pseudomonadota bacterium]
MAVFLMDGQGDKERENQLTVFAASSFAWVLHEQEEFIEGKTGLDIIIVEAASSTLARQIARSAPADVFITADAVWLDYLAEGGYYEGDPVKIARNRLVWATALHYYLKAKVIEPMGPIITGDPAYVPLGKYALEAMENIGFPEKIRQEIIPATSARDALRILETGNIDIGIIYKTDALSSEIMTIFSEIPEESHSPILYWAVAVKQSNSGKTKKFLDFLKSEDFKTILQSKGFEVN